MSQGKAKRHRHLSRWEEEEEEEEEEVKQEVRQRATNTYTPSPRGFGVVTEGTNTRDFLSVRDKITFNSVKKPIDRSEFEKILRQEKEIRDAVGAASRQPDPSKFRCVPSKTTYRTLPDTTCPLYTRRHATCCILRNENIFGGGFAYSEGREFLSALYFSLGGVRNTYVARQTFGADFMEWYTKIGNGHSIISTDVDIFNGARYRDVFLQFLFRANPTIDVKLGFDDPSIPAPANAVNNELRIFDASLPSWLLSDNNRDVLPISDDKKITPVIDLMRQTGVDGSVTYTYTPTTTPPKVLSLNCSKMIHTGVAFLDVTNAPELFASEKCGFNGKKDIQVKAIGVIAKAVSFYDFLFDLITSMPDINCEFCMYVDEDENPHNVDGQYTRLLPLRHCFATFGPDIDDVMEPILSLLKHELPYQHGPYEPPGIIATGGVVGHWEKRLHQYGLPGRGTYFLKLKLSISTSGDNYFSIKKRMIVPIGQGFESRQKH